MVPWSELEPDQAEMLLAVLLHRKPSAPTMKACRQDFDAIAALIRRKRHRPVSNVVERHNNCRHAIDLAGFGSVAGFSVQLADSGHLRDLAGSRSLVPLGNGGPQWYWLLPHRGTSVTRPECRSVVVGSAA